MSRDEWEAVFLEALGHLRTEAGAARAAQVHPSTIRYHKARDPVFRRRVTETRRLAVPKK